MAFVSRVIPNVREESAVEKISGKREHSAKKVAEVLPLTDPLNPGPVWHPDVPGLWKS